MFDLICPFCYEKFSRSSIEFRCENDDSPICKEDDPKLAAYFGGRRKQENRVIPNENWKNVWQKKSAKGFFSKVKRTFNVPNEVKCDKCKMPSGKRICPKCHNQLPTLFHQAHSHIISIIGARSSGKTHFITVVINELLNRGHLLDITTIPQDVGEDRNERTTQRYQRVYKGPLIDQQRELEQTQKNSKDYYPLIYLLKSGQKGFSKSKALYLVFYDTAGENFKDSEELKKLANYVSNSSGIIFLLDTFQVPEIKKRLQREHVSIPNIGVEFQDVFHQLYSLLQARGGLKLNAKSKIPIALTFSKIDEVFRHNLLGDDFQDFTIREDSSYQTTHHYSKEEMEDVSNDMRSLLESWGEEGFIHSVESVFSKHAYFGVSALGATPVGGRLQNKVTPHRVLDPLMWLLDNLGFALPKK
jgi:hypothetical protein